MNKIPKIIHYCWFGKAEIPQADKQNIEAWKEKFPEYEIREWNEDNFNVMGCKFSSQAYEKGKYAFVSDYARAKILYEYGGIYLDTDVEVLTDFPETVEDGYMGFERRKFIGTAMIATTPKNAVIEQLLEHYEKNDFVLENGSMDTIANVEILTDIMVEKGLILGGEEQSCAGFHIFPREVFYPKKLNEKEFRITKDTCAIHHCNNSWMTEREKKRGNSKVWINIIRPILQKTRNIMWKLIGQEKSHKLEIKIRNKLR